MMKWFLVVMFSAVSVCAESWTNAAGHSIEAELVGRKGNTLTMKKSDGSAFEIQLNGLSKACQVSAKKKYPEVKKTHQEVVQERNLLRLEQLNQKQVARENGSKKAAN